PYLVARDRKQMAIRSREKLLARRHRRIVARQVLHGGAPERLGAPISRLGFGILAPRFEYQSARGVGISLPAMAIDRVARAPIRIGATARLLDHRLGAIGVSIGLTDVAHRDQDLGDEAQRGDERAAPARYRALADLRLQHNDRVFRVSRRL